MKRPYLVELATLNDKRVHDRQRFVMAPSPKQAAVRCAIALASRGDRYIKLKVSSLQNDSDLDDWNVKEHTYGVCIGRHVTEVTRYAS